MLFTRVWLLYANRRILDLPWKSLGRLWWQIARALRRKNVATGEENSVRSKGQICRFGTSFTTPSITPRAHRHTSGLSHPDPQSPKLNDRRAAVLMKAAASHDLSEMRHSVDRMRIGIPYAWLVRLVSSENACGKAPTGTLAARRFAGAGSITRRTGVGRSVQERWERGRPPSQCRELEPPACWRRRPLHAQGHA